jgi:hypothetical protein
MDAGQEELLPHVQELVSSREAEPKVVILRDAEPLVERRLLPEAGIR